MRGQVRVIEIDAEAAEQVGRNSPWLRVVAMRAKAVVARVQGGDIGRDQLALAHSQFAVVAQDRVMIFK